MGMKMLVASFEEDKNKKLLADYKSLSEEVKITEFLNNFLKNRNIKELKVFEDDEEVFYKEIELKLAKSISLEVDERGKKIFIEIKNTSGNEKRKELISNAEDLFYFNILLKKYCNELSNNKNKIKLIIV